MQRLEAMWASVREAKRAAFVPFIMAGHPHPDHTVSLLHAMVSGGADCIELGVPFSDPMADGPTIEAAGHVALSHGVTLQDVLNMVVAFREQDKKTPIILMGYYNPIYRFGAEAFAGACSAAGVDGCIVVDLPSEEANELAPALKKANVAMIMLATPTSSDERLPAILSHATGHLYYVAVAGITGTASADYAQLETDIARVKAQTDLPVTVGFGIKTREDVSEVARFADGVVVGSALVKMLDEKKDYAASDVADALKAAIADLASGCNKA